MQTKFRYPTGVKPLLIDAAARRRRLETGMVATLERAGFDEILLPIIDYVEPYAQLVDRAAARQSYRFTDREGELVAIRSDFTPMVARALAPEIAEDELPLRVFYRGDVIRCEATRLGRNREMFQIGAEIIGDPTPDADLEAMRLASELARAAGLTPLIVYNDVTIADALGDAARAALLSKEAAAPENALTLEDLLADPRTRAAAERLDEIGRRSGPGCSLHLDDVDETSGYYTGIRFRLFDATTRRRVAQGGRYDTLYERFGTPAPAVGFTFTLDEEE
jgi:ATP phosphoribosyltransferase regulatory subunit